MIAISATADPSRYLTSPDIGAGSVAIWQLRIKCGLVIGGLDTVVDAIAHFSPLQEWVFKPLGGDWDALDRGAVAWQNAGKAANAIKENIESLPKQIGDSWQGKTQQSFARSQKTLAAAIEPLPAACEAMAQFCTGLADMARAIAEFVVDIITALTEFMIEMLASLAVPVAGEIAMPVWMAKLGIKLARWLPKLTQAIHKFLEFAERMFEIIEMIRAMAAKVETILNLLNNLANTIATANSAASRAITATSKLA